jgi:hypothetical protein
MIGRASRERDDASSEKSLAGDPTFGIRKEQVMKKVLVLLPILVGLSACYAGGSVGHSHAGIAVGDNGQHRNRNYASADPLALAIAQASIGTIPATNE